MNDKQGLTDKRPSTGASWDIFADSDRHLNGKLIVITGVGRSGTTVAGKLLGSMLNAHYLFEPLLVRLATPLVGRSTGQAREELAQLFKTVLVEDYIRPLVQGRATNCNPDDDSYFGNYVSRDDLETRWKLTRRDASVSPETISRHRYIIKIPEFQKSLSDFQSLFPGARSLHIYRNGLEVIASGISKGWYTDDFLRHSHAEWASGSGQTQYAPWFLSPDDQEAFPRWSPLTRAACCWRTLTSAGIAYAARHPNLCWNVRYEDFAEDPEAFVAHGASLFALEPTEITQRHLASVSRFKTGTIAAKLDQIESPERERFSDLMSQLNYI